MAVTDPTTRNVKGHWKTIRRAQELLKKHEHCMPVRTLTVGEEYITDYYCPECKHPRGGHHKGCEWKDLIDADGSYP
jgi:hypothetical protein